MLKYWGLNFSVWILWDTTPATEQAFRKHWYPFLSIVKKQYPSCVHNDATVASITISNHAENCLLLRSPNRRDVEMCLPGTTVMSVMRLDDGWCHGWLFYHWTPDPEWHKNPRDLPEPCVYVCVCLWFEFSTASFQQEERIRSRRNDQLLRGMTRVLLWFLKAGVEEEEGADILENVYKVTTGGTSNGV